MESLKAAAGAAYEAKLEAALSQAGIAFASEADLRADGFARTPVRPKRSFMHPHVLRCADVALTPMLPGCEA